MRAKGIVYGMDFGRTLKVYTGKEGISDLDKLQQLCAIYGVANMDINALSEKTKFAKHGYAMGMSRWMYAS